MNWKSLLNISIIIIVFCGPLTYPSFAYVWPMSNSSNPFADDVTSAYGPRELNLEYDFHGGIDIHANEGQLVHAIAGHGKVKRIDFNIFRGHWL